MKIVKEEINKLEVKFVKYGGYEISEEEFLAAFNDNEEMKQNMLKFIEFFRNGVTEFSEVDTYKDGYIHRRMAIFENKKNDLYYFERSMGFAMTPTMCIRINDEVNQKFLIDKYYELKKM